ncbi:NAD(P)H-hydrate dehydratase [Methanolapillus ohkumae]|uniref:Multifunctional fusion protein n=1 Tax=Methanolapillus ohkumae TaxID=3028298 RepID=A0AA96V715_9EURY|nr:ATP-dependent (S)-NAD(P)H-hydrate dehydratase [Methanosarcinaceae archaeon Am2]
MKTEAISASEMKAIDKNAVYFGMSPLQLMENAGACVSDVIFNYLNPGGRSQILKTADSANDWVIFFAGLGNNGGDTFVAARHLSGQDIRSMIILLGEKAHIKTEESQKNYALLEHDKNVSLFEIRSESELENFFLENEKIIGSDSCGNSRIVLVDGIFGTGFLGPAKGLEKKAIDLIHSQKKNKNVFVLSVDIPSGLEPEPKIKSARHSRSKDSIVVADATVTFHQMKTFLQAKDAAVYTGKIFVKPIGIPFAADVCFGPGNLENLYVRDKKSHKGDSGKVLIIGGGPYTGAPALAGMAALKAGADIVTVAVPKPAFEAVAAFSPNLIVKKLSADILCDADLPVLSVLIAAHDAVVIGPGLGADPKTISTVSKIIPLCKKVIADADALQPEIFEIIQKLKLQTKLPKNKDPAKEESEESKPEKTRTEKAGMEKTEIILTPHRGEFLRILKYLKFPKAEKFEESDLEELVLDVCRRLDVTLLLKGPTDLISDGKRIRRNLTGNPAMSVGGTGDVLSGIAGGLFTKNSAFESAGCAAFVCGCAGDQAFLKAGNSLLATDVILEIPDVFIQASGSDFQQKKNESGKNKRTSKQNTDSSKQNTDSDSKDGTENEISEESEMDEDRQEKLMEIMKRIKPKSQKSKIPPKHPNPEKNLFMK